MYWGNFETFIKFIDYRYQDQDYRYENNFPHKLLLTDIQVSKIGKAFENGSSANIKFSKTQFSKITLSGRFNVLDLINPAEVVYKTANKEKDLSNNVSHLII